MSKKDIAEKLIDFAVKPGKCDVRLSEEEMSMLEKLSDIEEVTKSDIMRKALRLLFRTYNKEK